MNFIHKENFKLNVSMGKMRGARYIHKFGAVPQLSQNTEGSVWDVNDTVYPWSAFDTPAAASVLAVSAGDDGKTIEVEGLDENFDVVKEDIVVSSAGAVTGTQVFARIYRAFIKVGDSNEGNIDIQVNATTVARISAGIGQTLMSVLTIPDGHTGYMFKGICTAESGADGSGFMLARYAGTTAFRVGHTFEVNGSGGEYQYETSFPFPFPERTDIDVHIKTRTNNGRYTVAYDILIIEDDV